MRSHSLVLGVPAFSLFAGCTFGSDHDYQVAVSWLINGTAPNQAMCQEQRVAHARFDVWHGDNAKPRSLEADCAASITVRQDNDDVDYGGFYTPRLFAWEVSYDYTLTLVDASDGAVSMPDHGSFELGFNEADVYQLSYLDFVQPMGSAAALYGEWSIGSGDLATSCTAQRIQTVQIQVTSALDTNYQQKVVIGQAPCSDGQFRSPGKILATGFYNFRYVGISDGGAEVDPGDSIQLFVDGTSDVTLRREIFLDGK